MSPEIADVVYTPEYFMDQSRQEIRFLGSAVMDRRTDPGLDERVHNAEMLVQVFPSGSPEEHTSTEGYKLERLLITIKQQLAYLRAQEAADSLQGGQEERLSKIREYLQ